MNRTTLYNFFSNRSSDAEKEAIKRWLEESPTHYEELYRERSLYDAMMLAKEDAFLVESKRETRWRIGYTYGRELMKWAAVILVTFISSYLIIGGQSGKQAGTDNILSVPSGQYVSLILSDGTKVFVNANSSLTYPSSFIGDSREVHLNGEAFFEVTKDSEHPFIVKTALCDVEVLGTKFNVEAYENRGNFYAALMEGAIKLNRGGNAKSIQLEPNYKVTLAHDGELVVNRIVDYDLYRWKEGLICFRELSFCKLMSRLEKYYGVKFSINNGDLSKLHFSGKFKTADGVENLLRVLQKDADFSFKWSEDKDTIYIE